MLVILYVGKCMSVFITEIHQKIKDWKAYLMESLVGAHTLPVDFNIKVTPTPNPIDVTRFKSDNFNIFSVRSVCVLDGR